MKKIVEMMEYVEENDEKITENALRKKYGEKNFSLFSRYCLGGEKPYARDLGHNKIEGEGKIKLTQDGVRQLHLLKKDLAEDEKWYRQHKMNIILVIATVLSGIAVTFDTIREVTLAAFNKIPMSLYYGQIGSILIIALVLFVVGWKALK